VSDDPLLTPKETAAVLRVSLDTLDGIVADGDLVFVNVGRGVRKPRRMFARSDIDGFINRRKRRRQPCISTKGTARKSGRLKSGSRASNIVDLPGTQIKDWRQRLRAARKPTSERN
jgi:excisionase family DNA binding protein